MSDDLIKGGDTFHRVVLVNRSTVYLRDMREASVLGHACVAGDGCDSDAATTHKLHIIQVKMTKSITRVFMSRKYACLLAEGE
jgi:hypothetical protein